MRLLEVLRFSSQNDSTIGALFDLTSGRKFLCFTLEDEFRLNKVAGETRIPQGTYNIQLRTEGGFHERYKVKYPDMHKGMLHITNVPNFEYILIHSGNDDDDTAGCLLVGNTANQNITKDGFIGESGLAYQRIYPSIAGALEAGQEVKITYINYDSPSTQ